MIDYGYIDTPYKKSAATKPIVKSDHEHIYYVQLIRNRYCDGHYSEYHSAPICLDCGHIFNTRKASSMRRAVNDCVRSDMVEVLPVQKMHLWQCYHGSGGKRIVKCVNA